MEFNYLSAQITSNRNLIKEMRANSIKALQISSSLKDTVRNNKYMSTESGNLQNLREIYLNIKTSVNTCETKSLLRSTEINSLRTIKGVTLQDQIRRSTIAEYLEVEDLVSFQKVEDGI